MALSALLLVLVAAVLHASWNFAAKHAAASRHFALVTALMVVLIWLPLALVMIGDMFSFEERARVQGLFSAVWGVSSIAGPLLGGFLVDRIGWPSVFYINVPFGILSAWLVWPV